MKRISFSSGKHLNPSYLYSLKKSFQLLLINACFSLATKSDRSLPAVATSRQTTQEIAADYPP